MGVTHECDFPPFVRDLPKVTRTLIPHDASSHEIDSLVRERLRTQRALYTLDMPVLLELKPELIVTQALCDVCAVSEAEVTAAACSLPGSPSVVNLEPMSLDEVFLTLQMVGEKAGVADRGPSESWRNFERVPTQSPNDHRPSGIDRESSCWNGSIRHSRAVTGLRNWSGWRAATSNSDNPVCSRVRPLGGSDRR